MYRVQVVPCALLLQKRPYLFCNVWRAITNYKQTTVVFQKVWGKRHSPARVAVAKRRIRIFTSKELQNPQSTKCVHTWCSLKPYSARQIWNRKRGIFSETSTLLCKDCEGRLLTGQTDSPAPISYVASWLHTMWALIGWDHRVTTTDNMGNSRTLPKVLTSAVNSAIQMSVSECNTDDHGRQQEKEKVAGDSGKEEPFSYPTSSSVD